MNVGRLHLAQQSRARRLARYEEVHQLQQQGLSERAIARQLQISRTIVRRFLAADQFPERSARLPRSTPLTPYHDYLHRRWAEGCHNSAQLWRELRTRGYRGQRSSVRDFVAPWRQRNQQPPLSTRTAVLGQPPSPRWTARLLLQAPERLTEEQRSFLNRLTELNSDIGQAAELAQHFAQIVRERKHTELKNWTERAHQSKLAELRRFAAGLRRDAAAVQAALREPWSNGPVEGQIHRLKLIKRQMYGRGKLDLLRQRLLYAA